MLRIIEIDTKVIDVYCTTNQLYKIVYLKMMDRYSLCQFLL